MMKYIAHRVNTVEQLRQLPLDFGVEVDLRDDDGRIILSHDPFIGGEDFEAYLKMYKHGLMILNIKSDRIEDRVLALIKQYGIKDYFFLDSTIPTIHYLSKQGETKSAARLSEFESIESVLLMKDKVSWVWVDCFTRLILEASLAKRIREAGLKICLVSPELQGRPDDLMAYRDTLKQDNITLDAVCSKQHLIHLWQQQ